MLGVIIGIAAGILAGTLTGITPGLHANLVASIVAGITWNAWGVGEEGLAAFLVALAITHTFLDAIPVVLLGVAEGSELLVLQPSQRYVLDGRGLDAIMLLTAGALFALLASICLVPLFGPALSYVFTFIKPWTAWLLFGALVWLIVREENARARVWALIVVLAAGILGIITLRHLDIADPLLPLLSGLFGTSSALHAMLQRTTLPRQETPRRIPLGALPVVGSTVAGALITLLPGVGPAQAGIACRTFFRRLSSAHWLVLSGGINTANMALSILTAATLGFARNGAIEVLDDLVHVTTTMLPQLLGIALIAGGIATMLTMLCARGACTLLQRVHYGTVSLTVVVLVAGLVTWRTSFVGLAVLCVSTACGLTAILSGTPRHHLMAAIIVPVLWQLT